MKTVRNAIVLTLCLSAGAAGVPSLCLAGVDANVQAPPPPRAERAPPPRDGYVWAPGYWDWSGRAYHWVSGDFVVERRGRHWHPDQWQEVGGSWEHVRGYWER